MLRVSCPVVVAQELGKRFQVGMSQQNAKVRMFLEPFEIGEPARDREV
jgi:hypothetical protein